MQMQHGGVPRQSARKPAGMVRERPPVARGGIRTAATWSTHEHQPPASLEQVKTRTPRKGSDFGTRLGDSVLPGLALSA